MKWYTYKGKKYNVNQLAKELGLKPSTLYSRLHRGWGLKEIASVDVTINKPKQDIVKYILDNCEESNGCLLWTKSTVTSGYGYISHHGGKYVVHRLVYMEEHGYDLDSTPIRHTCGNKLCCNVSHLYSCWDMMDNDQPNDTALKTKILRNM